MDHTKKQTKQLIHDKTWDDDEEEEDDDDGDTQTKNEKNNQYKNITTIPKDGKQKPELNGKSIIWILNWCQKVKKAHQMSWKVNYS